MIIDAYIEHVKQRLKELPKMVGDTVEVTRKQDADLLIKYWRSGLLNNKFSLAPLSQRTIEQKIRLGYSRPTSPLYGLGMEGSYTYIKGLRIFKKSEGWVVRMTGRHHDSNIDNKGLFAVHEYGCNIKQGNRVVHIPARPAFHRAYQKVMKHDTMFDDLIMKIIARHIVSGRGRELADRIKKNAGANSTNSDFGS